MMLKVTPGAREAIIKYVTTIIGDGAATKVVTMVEKTLLQQWYHKKSMSYEPERVGFQVLSLRHYLDFRTAAITCARMRSVPEDRSFGAR